MDRKEITFDRLTDKIDELLKERPGRDEALRAICELLKEKVDHYDWVGFYIAEEEGVLALGPYAGEPTQHDRIPVGKGVCGRVAQTRAPLVIQDVSKETEYLSCSPDVLSEIVIPIMKGDIFVAELDIDSHQLHPFDSSDREFLEDICGDVAVLF